MSSSGTTEIRALLAERAELSRQLGELDAESERLARVVQRVGGLTTGPRPFTGAPPVRLASSTLLESEIQRLSEEMKRLTADISSRELELQALERKSTRRWLVGLVVVVVLVAACVAGFLVVR
ncbi:MAG: hypothetical protein AB7Q42_00495 [Acidimicrobiia bacterium]